MVTIDTVIQEFNSQDINTKYLAFNHVWANNKKLLKSELTSEDDLMMLWQIELSQNTYIYATAILSEDHTNKGTGFYKSITIHKDKQYNTSVMPTTMIE
jgi:hypothetical protein